MGLIFDNNKPCDACIARDYHINSLTEQIAALRTEISNLSDQLFSLQKENIEILQHMTGMRKVTPSDGVNFQSIPRKNASMSQRIAHAEKVSMEEAEPLKVKRNKEYEDRIASLFVNPEIAIQEDSTQ